LENIYFNIFDVLCLFGGFLAFLLGCIFVFNEKFKTKSNIALAISLFSVFFIVLNNIYSALDFVTEESLNFYLPLFYIYFIPLGFYYSIRYLLNPDYEFQQKDYWAFVPVILVGIADLIYLFLYLFSYEVIKDHFYLRVWYADFFLNISFLLYWIFTSILNWKQINQYQKQLLNNYAHIEGRDLQWLRDFLRFSFIALTIFVAIRVGFTFFPVYAKLFFYLLWLLTLELLIKKKAKISMILSILLE